MSPAPTPPAVGTPVLYVAIGGTWTWSDTGEGQWWHPASALTEYLMLWRLFPLRPSRPFRWSGRLGGVHPYAHGSQVAYQIGYGRSLIVRGQRHPPVPGSGDDLERRVALRLAAMIAS